MAQAMPFRDGAFAAVVCTYPGPWIAEHATWDELARVTTPSATIAVLLGGTYARGPWRRVRSALVRVAYGSSNAPAPDNTLQLFGHDNIASVIQQREDAWGSAVLWIGTRR
jgi:hypothetical protein